MDRFVSTYENKIDARGRCSLPAPFRAVLENDGYRVGGTSGIYCYPSLDAPALDAGGQRLAQKIDDLLAALPDYSDERDELSVALYGDVTVLPDRRRRPHRPFGRVARSMPAFKAASHLSALATSFKSGQPEAFAERRRQAREKVRKHKELFDAGRRLSRDAVRGESEGPGRR